MANDDYSQRFWSRVRLGAPDECWEWTGGRLIQNGKRTYGRFCSGGAILRTHRVAWELSRGAAPTGLFVLHRCDNPPCCNPQHLWLGTRGDNNRDRAAKGRSKVPPSKGEKNSQARLSQAQVDCIREKLINNERLVDIADQFGVAASTIGNIKIGRRWKNASPAEKPDGLHAYLTP